LSDDLDEAGYSRRAYELLARAIVADGQPESVAAVIRKGRVVHGSISDELAWQASWAVGRYANEEQIRARNLPAEAMTTAHMLWGYLGGASGPAPPQGWKWDKDLAS
jgi:hypothetical protein